MKTIKEIHETIDGVYLMCLDRIALGTWQISDKTILEEILNGFSDVIDSKQKEEIKELIKLYEQLIQQQKEAREELRINKYREEFSEIFSKFLKAYKEGKLSEKSIENFKKKLGLYRAFLTSNQIEITIVLIKKAELKLKEKTSNKTNKEPKTL